MGMINEQSRIEERKLTLTQLELVIKPATIAAGLNRSASTFSLELHRDAWIRSKLSHGPQRPLEAGG
jgi:IS30 family transposase